MDPEVYFATAAHLCLITKSLNNKKNETVVLRYQLIWEFGVLLKVSCAGAFYCIE